MSGMAKALEEFNLALEKGGAASLVVTADEELDEALALVQVDDAVTAAAMLAHLVNVTAEKFDVKESALVEEVIELLAADAAIGDKDARIKELRRLRRRTVRNARIAERRRQA